MNILTQSQGYEFLILFGIIMFITTWIFARWKKHNSKEGFLVAERKVNWWLGGASIAASWIWAPALFISSQIAYEQGLPGIFWFTLPNILALAIFAFLGPKIRKKFSRGFTLPQWIKLKLKSKKLHKAYVIPYLYYQIMAITVQLFAGGSLVSLMTGISIIKIMPLLLLIALAYALISGLEASVITDVLQLATIFIGAIIIIPWTIKTAGGVSAITLGLGGLSGKFTNIFDPGVAFSFGIISSLGLISGAICDQQYWQRTFAIKKRSIKKSFVFGALLFGLVPIALSTLGFLGANANLNISLPAGIDSSMIGIATVTALLPEWATILFVVFLLAGLSSTLDSGLVAFSSLYATDIMKPNKKEKKVIVKNLKGMNLTKEEENIKKQIDKKTVKKSRIAMIISGLIGLILALSIIYIPQLNLTQLWLIMNSAAACIAIPTILSLYWNRLSAKGAYYGIITAFLIGVPLFAYSNITNNTILNVISFLLIIMVSTLFCIIFAKKNPKTHAYKG